MSTMRFYLWRVRLKRCSVTAAVTAVLACGLVVKLMSVQPDHASVQYPTADNQNDALDQVPVMDIKLDRSYDSIEFNDTFESDSTRLRTSAPDFGPIVAKNSDLITILMWNPFFKNDDYYFGVGQEPFIRNGCKVQTCQTSRDHALLDTADVLLIHGPRVDEPMPPYRPAGQLYVYLQAEPHYNGSKTYLPAMNNMFNITLTNRRDSDIHLAYGLVEPSSTARRLRGNVVVSPLDKPKAVVWPVSHCNTPGRRERYVKELQKHVPVDIYGACGPHVCPKSDLCMEQFTREYKFYLSLENHYCRDYVTEKLYRTLEYDMIPIVFGGANYNLDAPPHSVINIIDYPDPKDLADYLDYLSHNVTAYNEYFEWKNHYVIEHFRHVIFGKAFCKLCEILHTPNYEYKDFRDIYSWWVDGMCDPNVIGRMARQKHWFDGDMQ